MITRIQTVDELKEIFVETLINHTDKVTKVSDTSVLNGVAFGVAKIGQKVTKDIAVIESHIFPDSAYGEYLDKIAKLRGVSPRKGKSESSVYVRIFGEPGTQYIPGVHTFFGNQGVIFDIDTITTIPSFGFTYAKLRSQTQGLSTNVEPLSINKVSPQPAGHSYVINEYTAEGGRDEESDSLFRERIKREINIISKHTLSYLEQVFTKINPNVLRCFHYGFNSNNEIIIGVATVNGINLTNIELNDILVKSEKYLSLCELRPYGINNTGIYLRNVEWQPIDISFRVDMDSSYDVDDVRKRIQVNLSKEFDYRFWDWTKKIEWDNLLEIVKNTDGVRYVADNYFYPQVDITVHKNKLPRIRGFQMLNLNGELISNFTGTLNPVYYPNDIDFFYQADLLSNI
jgi:hypothetical protein